jgi:serine/threonine-protein kinase
MPEAIQSLNASLAGRYVLERELGAGGMATVYLARDVKHDRRVALKVLRPELAAVVGAERFLAEIRTTANLQHPHILALHDSGEVEGTVFYVMPFVEGESLRDLLDREKQLPVADAVRIAIEVCGALDYAHRKGTVHRDIKPENILLNEGRALVADFGIALAASSSAGARLTETGMSLGTPHYMSPEQATGERGVDGRSDMYSLACVLHEMLVGEPPFTGPTAQAIVARVITDEAPAVGEARKTVPTYVEDALLTALEKLPADRFGSAAEFARALEGADAGSTARRRAGPTRSSGPRYLWPIAFLVVAALALWGWLRPAPPAQEQPPSQLAVLVPSLGGSGTSLQRQLALTPDGSALLYTAIAPDGENRTMYLSLDETEPTVLPGVAPFLSSYVVSPDGREFIGWVGTQANMTEGYRYSISGGSSRPLPLEVGTIFGAAWGDDGSLWFSPLDPDRGVVRLTDEDGVTVPFGPEYAGVTINQILPGGSHALYVLVPPLGSNAGPAGVMDLTTGERTILIDFGVVAIGYTAGYLVYALPDGSLEASAFDPDARSVSGDPVRIATGLALTGTGVAQFTVANNGTVAYQPEEPRSLTLLDRDGRTRLATSEARNFHAPMFSPNGRRISTDFNSADGRDVWILNLDDGGLNRATFDRDGHDATWTPDGEALIYTSLRDGTLGVFRTRPGSAEAPEALHSSVELGWSGHWLSDMSALVSAATSLGAGTGTDLVLIPDGGAGPLEPLVVTRFEEQHPSVSPDDRWLAFSSDQTGRPEVYVRPLRGDGDQLQVSLSGGIEPVWSRDGRELFYRSGPGGSSQLMAAAIQTEPALSVTSRTALFPAGEYQTATPHSNYDVSPDGQTFAMVRYNPSTRIMVIQNLPALVRRLGGGG